MIKDYIIQNEFYTLSMFTQEERKKKIYWFLNLELFKRFDYNTCGREREINHIKIRCYFFLFIH
jgi:hypothetical protein